MKKLTVIIAILLLILCINKEEKYQIPKESIRFRVIASSNNEKDQTLKKQVVKNLSNEIKKVENTKSLQEARLLIKKELPNFKQIVNKTIKEQNMNNSFQINYGLNHFPQKKYQNNLYTEGEYESLVITLGSGKGKNFWCVLFPPLCFEDKTEQKQYKSIIKEILKKYF